MKVKDYGDMLGQVKNKKCLGFVRFGSYSGDWVSLLDSGDNVELWKGYYGSCSGCDWLESNGETDYRDDSYLYEVSDEKANEYFKEDRPFVEIPKSIIKDMTLEQFDSIFPANIREDIYDFDNKEMFETLKTTTLPT